MDRSQVKIGTCDHFIASMNSAGVSARIIHNSKNANAAVEKADREKSRWAQEARLRYQTRQ